jgi:arylsulfatase A-like enzyme
LDHFDKKIDELVYTFLFVFGLVRNKFKGSFIPRISIIFLCTFVSLFSLRAAKRPDVLLICIEDVSPHRLGTYCNSICKTPHLDQFAEEGIRFDLAFCSAPSCNPSRSSMLSGLRPETTGIIGNTFDWRKILKVGTTLPEHFEANGYKTIRVGRGKIFHGGTTDDNGRKIYFSDTNRFTRTVRLNEYIPDRNRERQPLQPRVDITRINKELFWQGKDRIKLPFNFGPTGKGELTARDAHYALQAAKILSLEEDDDEPLFLAVGFRGGHPAFKAPDKYFDLYPLDKIKLPDNPPDDLADTPYEIHNDHKIGFHNKELWKDAIAAHFAAVTFVDNQIGKVLTALKKTGRADNTIVIIWSDHGHELGEHFQWRKGHLFDYATRVIFLMKVPGLTAPGSVCKRPVESIDIYPTLCDLCGIPIPEGLEGISMKPLLKDPDITWKKGAITSAGKNMSIHTQCWRYSEYEDGGLELYDKMNDPGEFDNLALNPEYSDTINKLSELLNAGWKACLPPGY